MRPINNEDRWQRVEVLSKTLDNLADARRKLLLQLGALDVQVTAVRKERNMLHNLAVPISTLPDEVLALIFEEGTYIQPSHPHHFGVLVSHVIRRWRHVALESPRLWTSIRCIALIDQYPVYSEGSIERISAFLSRSRCSPIDIYIQGFLEDNLSTNFLQVIGDHIGHCRQLLIKDGGHAGLMMFLKCIASRTVSLLDLIDVDSGQALSLPGQPFLPGVHRLKTVQLDCVYLLDKDMSFGLPAFKSVTSLRLGGICIEEQEDVAYNLFRDGLMAMHSLSHLELDMVEFQLDQHHEPIVLPTVQFLQIEALEFPESISPLVHSFQAASLATLSLTSWNGSEPDSPAFAGMSNVGAHFPSLQHLILANISRAAPALDLLAQTFPAIERLTCHEVPGPKLPISQRIGIEHVVAAVARGGNGGNGGSGRGPNINQTWPSLKCIAISTEQAFDAAALEGVLRRVQELGHPLHKLMLPQTVSPPDGSGAMAKLRTLVDMEDFRVDWPTPFGWAD